MKKVQRQPPLPEMRPVQAPARRPSASAGEAGPADRVDLSSRAYYDADRDRAESRAYYGDLTARLQGLSPREAFHELSSLVYETHEHHLAYDPKEYLYPWVDLRPNLRLQSLYDPRPVAPAAPVRVAGPKDLTEKVRLPRDSASVGRSGKVRTRYERRSLADQAEAWVKALAQGPTDAVQIAQKIAEIETKSYFNCEHVVPKIWYKADQPMKGDLHHLFTCEKEANEDRGSQKLTSVEPSGGKGAAARATLYFLLRYPGKVGDHDTEYSARDVQTLLRWHREDPVSLYERHRNQAIFELQGNRNPLIDHPDWADRIDFTAGLGKVRKPLPRKAPGAPSWPEARPGHGRHGRHGHGRR